MNEKNRSMSKIVLLCLGLGISVLSAVAFVIVGAISGQALFPGMTGGVDFFKILGDLCTKVIVPIFTFDAAIVGTSTFYVTFIGTCIFALLTLLLWIFGIVRKKLHYLFSGLMMILVAYIYITFSAYFFFHIVEQNVFSSATPFVFAICGGLGAALSVAFGVVDLVKKPIDMKQTTPVLATDGNNAVKETIDNKPAIEPEPVEEKVYTTNEGKDEDVIPLVKEPVIKANKVKEEVNVVAKKKKKPAAKKETKKPTKTTAKKEAKKPAVKKEAKKPVTPKKEETVVVEKNGTGKVYHVSYRADKRMWQVKAEGSNKVNKMFVTQKEAADYAKTLDDSVKVHSRVGKIRKV